MFIRQMKNAHQCGSRQYAERSEIIDLLDDAISVLASDADNYEMAAWRVADAGLLLREFREGGGNPEPIGLGRCTGLGAMLPLRGHVK